MIKELSKLGKVGESGFSKNRIEWIDSYKGLLALSVILGHALQMGLGNDAIGNDYTFNLIYSVHMPAFVAVSGFLVYRRNQVLPSYLKYVKKRLLMLMIPFVIWTLLFYLHEGEYTIEALLHYIVYPESAYWFLWTLFIICCLFEFIRKIAGKAKIPEEILIGVTALILVALMVLKDIRVFGYQYISWYFLFYSIGYFLRKYDIMIKNKGFLFVSTITYLIAAFFWRMQEAPSFLAVYSFIPETIQLYSYRFIVALLGVISLFGLSFNYMNGTSNKFILWVGYYSLGIYTTQLLLSHIIPLVTREIWCESNQFTIVITTFITITIVSVLLVKILSNYSITNKLFLGKY